MNSGISTFFRPYVLDQIKSQFSTTGDGDGESTTARFPMSNYIVYGGLSHENYALACEIISEHSPSRGKFVRSLRVQFQKKEVLIPMGDTHFEVDIRTLGSSAKYIWTHIMQQIRDIVVLRTSPVAFVVCKNFHCISNEMLELFTSNVRETSMHDYAIRHRSTRIYYIVLVQNVSFFPRPFLARFHVHRSPMDQYRRSRDSSAAAADVMSSEWLCRRRDAEMDRIRAYVGPHATESKVHELHRSSETYKTAIYEDLRQCLYTYRTANSNRLRNSLYDVSIYGWDIYEVMWRLTRSLADHFDSAGMMEDPECAAVICGLLLESNKICEQYSLNYRPILHIERFALQFAQVVLRLRALAEARPDPSLDPNAS